VYKNRIELYKQLEENRKSRVLVYVTGDRRHLETIIAEEVLDFFVHHLDSIVDSQKISLFLYTRGGNTLAAWSIVNLVRQFCKKLEVIVPSKARSAGTLICLGADNIVMTKQATLGPIDPSVNTPLNPAVPGAPATAKVPVSVEDINAFLEFSKSFLKPDESASESIIELVKQVHPLVLGNAFRARAQIRMLAGRLLSKQIPAQNKIDKILDFLCSESGSHDYTINRREARDELGLTIEKPDDQLYKLIKTIYDDIATELQLTTPYDPNILLGAENPITYSFHRALIESVRVGSHIFISEGRLSRQAVQLRPGVTQDAIRDDRSFEGWRLENP